MKKYKLLRTYEWPGGTVYENTIHTIEEWRKYFPLFKEDFENKKDWFEEVEPSHNERYELGEDQSAQIECHKSCFHRDNFFHCLNISPAIIFKSGFSKCLSFEELEYGDDELEDEECDKDECDEDECDEVGIVDPTSDYYHRAINEI
jgi:hypothetical protein